MEALNSTANRKVTPQQNMRNLEKAILMADQRVRMRRVGVANAQIFLVVGFTTPFATYLLYNFFAPGGVMQNYKASSGAYLNYMQNWLAKPKTATQIYRPEIDMVYQQSALVNYTRKIEHQKAEGAVQADLHHPTAWH